MVSEVFDFSDNGGCQDFVDVALPLDAGIGETKVEALEVDEVDNQNHDEENDDSSSSSSSSQSTTSSPLSLGGKGMVNGSMSSSSLSSTSSTSSTVSSSSSSSLLSSSDGEQADTSGLELNGRAGFVRRRVSFGQTNIQECIHHQDMTDQERNASWYTFQDFQRLKNDRRALVKLMDEFELKETKDGCVALPKTSVGYANSSPIPSTVNVEVPDMDDSIRGLEFRTKEGKRKRHSEIQSVVRAVLHEQSKSTLLGFRSFSMPSLLFPTSHSLHFNNYNQNLHFNRDNHDNDDLGNDDGATMPSSSTTDQEDPALSMAALCEMYTKQNILEAHKRGLSDEKDVLLQDNNDNDDDNNNNNSVAHTSTSSQNMDVATNLETSPKVENAASTTSKTEANKESNKVEDPMNSDDGGFFVVPLDDDDDDNDDNVVCA